MAANWVHFVAKLTREHYCSVAGCSRKADHECGWWLETTCYDTPRQKRVSCERGKPLCTKHAEEFEVRHASDVLVFRRPPWLEGSFPGPSTRLPAEVRATQ